MLVEQLKDFYQTYIEAFKAYNLSKVQQCYCLPCTLSTPDKMVVVQTEQEFFQEFEQIFHQLKLAKTKAFNFETVTFTQVSDTLVLLHGIWSFINEDEQVFADFSAYYQLIKVQGHWQITSVVSHEVNDQFALAHQLAIN